MNLEPRVSCALHNSLPRTKDKKRQKELGLDVQALFNNPSECNKLHPPSHLSVRSVLLHFVQRFPPGDPHPLQGRQKGLFNFDEARFSHFIDSLKSATRRWQIIRPFMSITPCLASFFYFFLFIKAFKENINIK